MTQRRQGAHIRICTYNMLLGGGRREEAIMGVLRRADADVIALQEASDLRMVRRLADALEMTVHVGRASDRGRLHVAILSRFPVVHRWSHRHANDMLRAHLVCELATGHVSLPRLRVHCVHLAARFYERAHGELRRLREITLVLNDLAAAEPLPHVLLGDFNSIAPGDRVGSSQFIGRMTELRRAGLVVAGADGLIGPPLLSSGHDIEALDAAWEQLGVPASLRASVPRLPPMFGPLTRWLPRHATTDQLIGGFIERRVIRRVVAAGYRDCFRSLHPRDPGFTCATWAPSARVDYVFADPIMGERLRRCAVVGGPSQPDAGVMVASDHFPVVGDFDL